MKNLFDFATKELSQDAFLRWLFDSWEDPDAKEPIMDLFSNFGIKINYDDITNITTFSQICKIDVTVVIETKDFVHLLFIEDKTFSNAHTNQLIKYDSHIFGGPLPNGLHDYKVLENINDRMNKKVIYPPSNDTHCAKFYNFDVHRVFYKTSSITDEDERFLNECKSLPNTFAARDEANKCGWKVFSIYDIINILSLYKKSKNLILAQYIEHLDKVYNIVSITDMPTSNSVVEWYHYFENNFKQKYLDLGYLVEIGIFNGNDAYMLLKCKNENCDELDFHSTSNEFVALMINNKSLAKKTFYVKLDDKYLTEDELIALKDKTDAMKDSIKTDHELFAMPLKVKNGYLKPDAKTIAYAIMPCSTTEEIHNSLDKCLEQIKHINPNDRSIQGE